MKILHIFPYLPTPANFGGALRIYYILDHLNKNHDVTVAGFSTNGDLQKFHQAFPALKEKSHFVARPWKQKIRKVIQLYSLISNHSYWYTTVYSKKLENILDQLMLENAFDLIQFEFPIMGRFLKGINTTKILDAHNVEYDNFRRMSQLKNSKFKKIFYRKEYEKLYEEETEICREQDAIFTTSERDQKLLDKDAPEVPKFVIPNGVDISYFQPSEEKTEQASLVFTGMMGYVPNYEGILWFLDEILPLIRVQIPEIKIYIVGKNPPQKLRKRARGNIIVTGFVKDVRPYVWRSSVYVVPLRMGGGTRLKVLEALAMKKPVVTTSIGCEGLDMTDNETALIADDPRDFADSVIELIRKKELRNQLSERGYDRVYSKYQWGIIGNKIEEAYAEIFRNRTERENKKLLEFEKQPK